MNIKKTICLNFILYIIIFLFEFFSNNSYYEYRTEQTLNIINFIEPWIIYPIVYSVLIYSLIYVSKKYKSNSLSYKLFYVISAIYLFANFISFFLYAIDVKIYNDFYKMLDLYNVNLLLSIIYIIYRVIYFYFLIKLLYYIKTKKMK